MSPRMTFGVVGAAMAMIIVAVLVITMGESTPTKDEPDAYTKAFVQAAIQRYERDGRQPTIDYYNSTDSVDRQWYVFIIDQDGFTVAHHNPDFRNRDPSLRVDATGYFYGDELLGATEEGRWVDYIFLNPDTGEETQKHTWIVVHDGLLFASGWYGDPASE